MSSEQTITVPPDLADALLVDPTIPITAGIRNEHILLETTEQELESEGEHTYTVRQRFELNNRIRGVKTEFTLFEEGALRIRERRRGKPSGELVIDFRYLDSKQLLSRFIATNALYAALGSMGFASLTGALAYFSVLPPITLSATLGSIVAAVVAMTLFIQRTHEQVVFHTKHGQARALTLLANVGCFAACRALVPKLVSAIDEAGKLNTQNRGCYLREEMREHYRLRDIGVLTHDACTTGTRGVLAQFG